MSTGKYDRVFEKVKDSDGEFTNEQLAKMVGFKPVTDVEKLVVPQVSAKVRSALESRLRKIEDFGKRGGFRRKRGAGRNDGVHQILRGDEFVRDQIAHNVIRLQQVMLETQYDNLKLMNDMEEGASVKTKNLMKLAQENAEVMARTMIGQMDSSISALQKRHPEFKEIGFLRDHLDDFYQLAFEPVEDEE